MLAPAKFAALKKAPDLFKKVVVFIADSELVVRVLVIILTNFLNKLTTLEPVLVAIKEPTPTASDTTSGAAEFTHIKESVIFPKSNLLTPSEAPCIHKVAPKSFL
jgi:predicted alpha/beta superfamily hydrolase